MSKELKEFVEKYLSDEFKNKTLVFNTRLEKDGEGVEIYGSHSVAVLVKEEENILYYKPLKK